MTTTTETRTCRHPRCETPIAPHELACRTHWYQLPTPLRNRIWRHYRHDPGGPHHLAAVADAIRHWDPPAVQLRCAGCKQYTDFTDETTGQPICLVCATAGMNTNIPPGPCSSCGRDAALLASLTDRPPHTCVDCLIRHLRAAETA